SQLMQSDSSDQTGLSSLYAKKSYPDHRQWLNLVQHVQEHLSQMTNPLKKVVLARQASYQSDQPLNAAAIWRRLVQQNPQATVFALALPAGIWLGATPEYLFTAHGPHIKSMCLAGTAPRSACPDEDERLARELWHSSKNRQEHEAVRQRMASVLQPYCEDLQIPANPIIRKLPTVQHLYTPIQGQLHRAADLWALAAALHPTPAVAGSPPQDAVGFLQQVEPFHRGWYAGVVGYVSLSGDAQFSVALRSALIHSRSAHLFAGCGIMPDSQPEEEWNESEWKMGTLKNALGIEENS
ncbi:MAG: isochorismate synthase, partial [Firmicutes bacterium]|nr:isochorismate synthase [Bacillota bacterium]